MRSGVISYFLPAYYLRAILCSMQLLSARIAGFKSFADKFDLQFEPGVTGIIGPNGSGKSNLAEAVRWVLGEQSTKTLRSKSSTDVIFAGTPKRKAASKAFVELLFSNEEGRFAVDSPEVAIGRYLNKQGESEYTINGDPARLLDIQHILAGAGIGTKTYTVISQGTIDQYITATPAARRGLFDEATGIKSLQLKLQEAVRKLEQVEQHMHELSLVQQELLPRLSVLEREAKRYEEKGLLGQEFAEKQIIYFHASWHKLVSELQELEQMQDAAETNAKAAAQEVAQIERGLFQAAQQNSSAPKRNLTDELQRAKQDYEISQQTHVAYEAEKKRLTHLISQVKKEKEEAQVHLTQKRSELVQFDWLKNMRGLLKEAQSALRAFLNDKTPTEDIEKLDANISHTLMSTDEDMPVSAAEALLKQIERPLREVARLETLEKEYSLQLRQLLEPAAPSSEKIQKLELALSIEADKTPTASHLDLPQLETALRTARQKELTCAAHLQAGKSALEEASGALAQLESEIKREKGTDFLKQVQTTTPDERAKPVKQNELRRLEAHLNALGEIDPLVLKEYEEVKARHQHIAEQLSDAAKTQINITELKENLLQHIQERFSQRFATINTAFGEYFTQLFGGGSAQLQLLPDGIEIAAQLPGKKTRHLHLLSGGEKSLASLALLFAILRVQEPPFLVLDEVDAALDEANADRFAKLLQLKSSKTQCIVITHNRATMGYAHVLYGVTMSEPGVSKIYSVKLNEIAKQSHGEEVEIKA